MSTLTLPVHNTLGRQRSVSDKLDRSASPKFAMSTMSRQRSISGQHINTDTSKTLESTSTGSLLSPPNYTQHHLSSSTSSMSDLKVVPSRNYLSPYDHPSFSASTDSLAQSLPTRKISSSNFIKLARQASDTAFRSVGLHRKASDYNLKEQQTIPADADVVYEQNPKGYIYQQQQQQQQNSRSRNQYLRPQCDDTVPGEWTSNNQTLRTNSSLSDDYYDTPNPQSIKKPFASKSLRKNTSMPDMKSAAALTALGSQSTCEPRPTRANTPQPPARPRVQLHHLITTSALACSEPTTVVTSSNSPQSTEAANSNLTSGSGDDCTQQIPFRPPRNQHHQSPYSKLYNQHQKENDQQRHHEQQRQRLFTRHHVLSDESLPEYGDAVLSVSSVPLSLEGLANNNNMSNNNNDSINDNNGKDLPPIPPGPLPSFSLPTRSRRRTEGSETDAISPSNAILPALPVTDTTTLRKGSSGIIPQDVLRRMDPKDVQKAVSSTVVASRVYKVLNSEQLESLIKEQEELQQFVEAMNVALHIETRMRDASHSLIRLHESNLNIDAVKAATNQLHATTFKMDQIVQKSQQAMWRLIAIQRLLLQHETAILNAGLRRLDNENRDLSRAVMNLETARGQEKAEKLKWKKEHTRLKVQSILFPTSPLPAEPPAESMPNSHPQLKIVQDQLVAMENYAKELSEDILQKDEKLIELKNELSAVKGWADDFEASIQAKKEGSATTASPETLQEQLNQLQSLIEADYKHIQSHTEELQDKVDILTEENLALTTIIKPEAPCKKCSMDESAHITNAPLISEQQQQQKRQTRGPWRVRPSPTRENSELHNVLRESLWEIERQIELDLNSLAPATPSTFSIGESPVTSRRSSSRSVASSSGRLSRASSTNSLGSAKLGLREQGLREQVLMREMTCSPETLGQVAECDELKSDSSGGKEVLGL
ncbi:hypothetical protein FBU30_003560 [Linnemannia zychae]|nr:hypothetical protein FBU30_003560 [Linnemannia zychae]